MSALITEENERRAEYNATNQYDVILDEQMRELQEMIPYNQTILTLTKQDQESVNQDSIQAMRQLLEQVVTEGQ